MSKPFPTRITVLGMVYKVQVVHNLIEQEDCVGLTIGDLRIIKICDSLDKRRRWMTLWHEVVHAALHVNGLGNELNAEIEEVIAQSLEHTLEQFLDQVGPEFIREVCSGD